MLGKIHHLGVAVRSIAERARFWTGGLGLGAEPVHEVPGEKVRVLMLPVGESRIELLEPIGEESVIAHFLRQRGEGIHHVCFAVPDLDAALALLTRGGHRMVGEAPRPGAHGSRVAFVHPKSSGGVLIELQEEREADPVIEVRSVVVVYLGNPREKYWGRLEQLTPVGVFLRGMDLAMVEDWAREIARGGPATMGLTSVFFPLGRIEKIFLDEDTGAARSVRRSFGEIVGRDVDEFV